MVQQDTTEVAYLVQALEAASKKGKSKDKKSFNCRKSTFPVARSNNISVDSWKFMDWDYKRDDLPTYARGLFTTRRKDGTPEIAVRGYDKFFNVDEVNDTKWRNIENNTRGPYELSVKENGCIIFLSGLEDDTLLVCSKHSTGTREDTNLSHAQAGERWVERHVAAVGKSVKDLAQELRRLNATAVGELCDDSFEEHVLAYDETASGIYLHGLNYNMPQFVTSPGPEVHAFADKWGFKKAKFVVYDDIDSVKKFLDGCAESGTWDGRETEGFVIRCQKNDSGRGPLEDWFFKYKFEEPYLMYRQWRECTKAVIAGKVPRIKKHKKITEEYLHYARRQLAKNPQLAKDYLHNHGIIAMREGFLQERGLKGSEIIAMEESEGQDQVQDDVILVPIASLGCGKTTVALALAKLFGWGHVQNDNIPKQKNKPKKFALDITNALGSHPVVIADRNNHMRRERQQLMDDVFPVISKARFVALQYVHEPKGKMLPRIREVTRRRVLDRGDNHQTIRAGSKNSDEVIGIMEGFLNRFEGIDTDREPDKYFDEIIDLDVAADSRENLETVVNALHKFYPKIVKQVPTPQELDDALDWAMTDYQVQIDLSHQYSAKSQREKNNNNKKGLPATPTPGPTPEALTKGIEYFNISLPAAEVSEVLQSLFPPSTPPEKARFYRQLVNTRRVQPAFHVTLIHRSAKKDRPDIWDGYTQQYIQKMNEKPESDPTVTPTLAAARVRLERLIWDNRLMAFVARIMPPEDQEQAGWACANEIPHITVGTISPDVKPKESNDLLQRWHQVGSGGDTGIWEAEIPGVRVVSGSVGLVMSRR
ncbi:hypothetical protein BBP40_009619 [Aspergillus hancockii]|nr:hypothetical protein BBP40_009619 [Aspergillus hancockii]